jgi:hypothetical protein
MLDRAALSIGVHGRCFHGCFQKSIDMDIHLDDREMPCQRLTLRAAPAGFSNSLACLSSPFSLGAHCYRICR